MAKPIVKESEAISLTKLPLNEWLKARKKIYEIISFLLNFVTISEGFFRR